MEMFPLSPASEVLKPRKTKDWEGLRDAMADFSQDWEGFDPKALVEADGNVLVTDGEGNYGLFECEEPGVFYGHYLFTARGPYKTFRIAKELLGYFFDFFEVETVMGLTPVDHRGANLLNHKLGFKYLKVTDTVKGPHHLVALRKEDFKR